MKGGSIIDLEYKVCSKCNENKPLEEFYSREAFNKKRGNYIYHNPECKECSKKKAILWKKNNRDKVLQSNIRDNKKPQRKANIRSAAKKQRESGYQRKYQQQNKNKLKEYNYNRRQKNHNITKTEWDLCKKYFNNECAYCGISLLEHKEIVGTDFHKEHVVYNGADDLSNCVPSCKSCNSQKWEFSLENWYNQDNPIFSKEKLDKINKWLNEDYKEI